MNGGRKEVWRCERKKMEGEDGGTRAAGVGKVEGGRGIRVEGGQVIWATGLGYIIFLFGSENARAVRPPDRKSVV